MQYAVVVESLKVRTAQYVNYSTLADNLCLSYEREVELVNAIGRNITWGDADVTLVGWQKMLDYYLEAVERDGERLGRTPEEIASAKVHEAEKFKRILPSSDFGPEALYERD